MESPPVERIEAADLKPIYVTSATGELTASFGMMQFQLDRPVFKSVEQKKSVIEKIRREVLVELHMPFGVWKEIGKFMTAKAERIETLLLEKSGLDHRFHQRKKWIEDIDAGRSSTRAAHIQDMENSEIVGDGYLPPLEPDKVPFEVREAYFGLEDSLHRIWTEAGMSYVYGFFQSSIFLLSAMLELIIEQSLHLKGLFAKYELLVDEKDRTLGRLIGFCQNEEALERTILEDAWKMNGLRINAVHMKIEKKETSTPPDEHPLVALETITQVVKEEQISIEARAFPGEGLLLDFSDPSKPEWRRIAMYKPQAIEAFRVMSGLFKALRDYQRSS